MDKRQQKFLEEVLWGLKMKTHQLIAISFVKNSDLEMVYAQLLQNLKDENITPLIQLRSPDKHRYLIMLSFTPLWGYVLRRRSDNWDYQAVVDELKEILHG